MAPSGFRVEKTDVEPDSVGLRRLSCVKISDETRHVLLKHDSTVQWEMAVARCVGLPATGLVVASKHTLEQSSCLTFPLYPCLDLFEAPAAYGDVVRLLKEVSRGLSSVHTHMPLHGDLSERVLVERDGEWIVAEPGLVVAVRKPQSSWGPEHHRAPEQALGLDGELGSWTDVYCLASVMWRWLTGEHAFTGEQTAASADLPEFKPVIELPDYVKAVLQRALTAEPLTRFETVAAFAMAMIGEPWSTSKGEVVRTSVPVTNVASPQSREGLERAVLLAAQRALHKHGVEILAVSGVRPLELMAAQRLLVQSGASIPLVADHSGEPTSCDGVAMLLRHVGRFAEFDEENRRIWLSRILARSSDRSLRAVRKDVSRILEGLAFDSNGPRGAGFQLLGDLLDEPGCLRVMVLENADKSKDPSEGVTLAELIQARCSQPMVIVITCEDVSCVSHLEAEVFERKSTRSVDADAVRQVLERLATENKRVRDALHLSALCNSPLPNSILAGFLGSDARVWFEIGWHRAAERARWCSGAVKQIVREQAEKRGDVRFLHRRLARAWARFDEHSGRRRKLEIGLHLLASGEVETAVPMILKSANEAWLMDHFAKCQHLLRLAAGVMKELSEPTKMELLLMGGRQSSGDSAQKRLTKALAGFTALRDRGGRVRAQLAMVPVLRAKGESKKSLKVATEAEMEAAAIGDANLHGRTLLACGSNLAEAGDLSEALAYLEDAETRFEVGSAPLHRARSTIGKAIILREAGKMKASKIAFEQAYEDLEQMADYSGMARAKGGLALLARESGELEESAQFFEVALQLALRSGSLWCWVEVRFGRADLHLQMREWEEAYDTYIWCAKWSKKFRYSHWAARAGLGCARVELGRRNLDEALVFVNEAGRMVDRSKGDHRYIQYRLVVALLLAHRNDLTQTSQWLWAARELNVARVGRRDDAELLDELIGIAAERGWGNVLRVAAPMAQEIFERIDLPSRSERVAERVRKALGR